MTPETAALMLTGFARMLEEHFKFLQTPQGQLFAAQNAEDRARWQAIFNPLLEGAARLTARIGQ